MPNAPSGRPSRIAIEFVAIAIILLAALVWNMRPAHPHLTPAPLQAPSAGCPITSPTFVPTNITSLGDGALEALPATVRNRVLLRANMEPCTCGCAMSIASCHSGRPACETSKKALGSMLDDAKAGASPSPATTFRK